MVNETVAGTSETLKRLDKVVRDYQTLGSSFKSRCIWARVEWSAESVSINELRNKVSSD